MLFVVHTTLNEFYLILSNTEVSDYGVKGWWVILENASPDSKVHGANIGLTWVLSAPYVPHAGPMNLAIWDLKGT